MSKILYRSYYHISLVSHIIIELIKFIELIEEEDDEVLFAIAEELGNIFSQISDKTAFIDPLETLCKQDETVVREAASKSLVKICETLNDSEIQTIFAPLVLNLAKSEWFTGRVSSCHLFAVCYTQSGSHQDRLRKQFIELCKEDTPMVRRACASKLGEFAVKLDK